MSRPLLIADIGGTNARFALVSEGVHGYVEPRTLRCDDYETPAEAITAYLNQVGAESPRIICFAVAGPIVDHTVSFTNNPWTIAASQLRTMFSSDEAMLLNDFEAIAWSIPAVNQNNTDQVGGVPERQLETTDFNVCVIGPGTGLGAAGLIKRNGVIVPVISEAGHVGFAAEDAEQLALLQALHNRYSRVSDERLVSGMGIRNLYWALGQIHDEPVEELSEAEIFDRGDDELATRAVELFFRVLGQAAGNLVLSLGAYDGAYIAGGIAQRHRERLAHSQFREGFENKGRHHALMRDVPSMLITHEQPGLLGAAEVARTLLKRS